RKDLKLVDRTEFGTKEVASTLLVADPLPRATFVPDGAVEFLDDASVLERFRAGRIDFHRGMYLEPADRPGDLRPDPAVALRSVDRYERPSSDVIVAATSSPSPGYVRLVEAWDEGWSASVDGSPAPILVAETFAM